MFYYIKGILAVKGDSYVVVDAGGVGYLINTSFTSMADAGAGGSEVTMYTYLHVREDIMDLYGFTTLEEKELFLKLLSVSGVGPKAALAVLSVGETARVTLAIASGDTKLITSAQGVGPKMAQRIILELKDKLDIPDNVTLSTPAKMTDNKKEAANALVSLGYSPQDAGKAVSGIDGSLSVEEIIKKALAALL